MCAQDEGGQHMQQHEHHQRRCAPVMQAAYEPAKRRFCRGVLHAVIRKLRSGGVIQRQQNARHELNTEHEQGGGTQRIPPRQTDRNVAEENRVVELSQPEPLVEPGSDRSCSQCHSPVPPLYRFSVWNAETEVLVEDHQLVPIDACLEPVQGSRRWSAQYRPVLVVQALVARAEKLARIASVSPPAVRAAQMRTAAIQHCELAVVLHAYPYRLRFRQLAPPVLSRNRNRNRPGVAWCEGADRSEEHTSEL